MVARRFDVRSIRTGEHTAVFGGVAVLVLVLVLLSATLGRLNFDVVVGAIVLTALALVSVPVFRWIARVEGDPGLFNLLLAGLVVKIVFTFIRYYFITVVYGDNGDAGLYSAAGSIFMELYRSGEFVLSIPEIASRGAETERIAAFVGMIYVVTGVSRYAASFIFSWLCFTGQVLMYRAFRRGVPEGDSRRYLTLLLFLPSLLFWPSSIGKEALMLFAVGLVSLGAAYLLSPPVKAIGVLYFAMGASVLFFIRPHMALIAIVSLAFASAASTVSNFSATEDKRGAAKRFTLRLLVLGLLIVAGSVAASQLSNVLGGGANGGDGLSGVLTRTKNQTAEGGSQFIPPAVASPLDIPNAVMTVLFRPYPWEASNVNGLIASAEGVLMGVLLFIGRRRVLSWVRALGQRPYLVFAAAFAFTFILAFSYIGNFGILARQRTQMLPLALTVLGMPVAVRSRTSWFGTKGTRIEDPTKADRSDAPHPSAVAALQSSIDPGRRVPQGESQ